MSAVPGIAPVTVPGAAPGAVRGSTLGTVAAAFAATASAHADRPFLYVTRGTAAAYGIEPGTITYGAMARDIAALQTAYAAAGYGPGHRVGLMLANRPDFFAHWFALNGLGAGVVPLNPEARAAELGYLVDHSEMVLVVAAPPYRDLARAAAPNLPLVTSEEPPPAAAVRSAGRETTHRETAHHKTIHRETNHRDTAHGESARDEVAHHDAAQSGTECALLYTSGTTGRPKGCVLSNDYYLRAGQWYATIGGLCAIGPEDRLITPLPLTHMNAMAFSALAMIAVGGCLVQLDRFHPASWWDDVRESAATIVHYLGVMPSMLLGAAPDPGDRGHAVRFGFGAGVDRRHHQPFETRFGFPLVEAWAMTETGAGAVVIANRAPRHPGTSCFGRPEPPVDVRVTPDDGELLVRAAGDNPRAGFFTEYLKDPAATEEAWTDGWFHTGDIVRADGDLYLYFVDRKKNIVRRSGENISAVEVESVLRRHALVAEAAVAAAPDDIRGEEVLACIVPLEAIADPEAVAREIVSAALADLSYFKVPGWIAFVEALPLTTSQKVARGELKSLAERLLADRRCIDTRSLKRR